MWAINDICSHVPKCNCNGLANSTFKNISYFILLGNCHAILLFHCVKYKCRGNWNCWIDTLNEVLSSTINLVKNGCHADMFVYLESLLFIRGKGNAAADLTPYLGTASTYTKKTENWIWLALPSLLRNIGFIIKCGHCIPIFQFLLMLGKGPINLIYY